MGGWCPSTYPLPNKFRLYGIGKEVRQVTDVRIEDWTREPFTEEYDIVEMRINIYGHVVRLRALILYTDEKLEMVEVEKNV